jgi:hypothetical protein
MTRRESFFCEDFSAGQSMAIPEDFFALAGPSGTEPFKEDFATGHLTEIKSENIPRPKSDQLPITKLSRLRHAPRASKKERRKN